MATSAVEYDSAEDVLRDADTAMYHAKETERGTVSFFDSSMHTHAVDKLYLSADIRRALDEQQFEVHYQPIVNLVTGRADRFEALVRWRHPERGLLLPGEFLPTMTETGLIVPLGHWVIDEVCRQLAAWGPAVANVSVNMSDREFWHPDLLPHILDSLQRSRRHGGPAHPGDHRRRHHAPPRNRLAIMRGMRDAGLELHIDDFGTGYSSLETLHRYPVDAFKIDRSFIDGLATSDRAHDLVRAIIAMGNALGLAVIAEGIETAEQLALLHDVGCANGPGLPLHARRLRRPGSDLPRPHSVRRASAHTASCPRGRRQGSRRGKRHRTAHRSSERGSRTATG